MKLHIITVGKPKLSYAKLGWQEYFDRLRRHHEVRVTALADKYANDASKILEAAANSYKVALVIGAPEVTSPELADVLKQRALEGKEVSWIIGGPDGLPEKVMQACDLQLGFSKLTFPHDLAMVILLEALYRASTINAGTPYHH